MGVMISFLHARKEEGREEEEEGEEDEEVRMLVERV
jgi:hypothetical protein